MDRKQYALINGNGQVLCDSSLEKVIAAVLRPLEVLVMFNDTGLNDDVTATLSDGVLYVACCCKTVNMPVIAPLLLSSTAIQTEATPTEELRIAFAHGLGMAFNAVHRRSVIPAAWCSPGWRAFFGTYGLDCADILDSVHQPAEIRRLQGSRDADIVYPNGKQFCRELRTRVTLLRSKLSCWSRLSVAPAPVDVSLGTSVVPAFEAERSTVSVLLEKVCVSAQYVFVRRAIPSVKQALQDCSVVCGLVQSSRVAVQRQLDILDRKSHSLKYTEDATAMFHRKAKEIATLPIAESIASLHPLLERQILGISQIPKKSPTDLAKAYVVCCVMGNILENYKQRLELFPDDADTDDTVHHTEEVSALHMQPPPATHTQPHPPIHSEAKFCRLC